MVRLTKKQLIENLKKLGVSFDENTKFEDLKKLLTQNLDYAGVGNNNVPPKESGETSKTGGEILTDHGIFIGLKVSGIEVVDILSDNGTAKHCKMSDGTMTWIPYVS